MVQDHKNTLYVLFFLQAAICGKSNQNLLKTEIDVGTGVLGMHLKYTSTLCAQRSLKFKLAQTIPDISVTSPGFSGILKTTFSLSWKRYGSDDPF